MASKLTNSDIFNVDFQGDVDSFPLRKNFENIKNKTNEIVDALSSVAIGTTNAETTAARPYHTDIKTRLDSIWSGQTNYVKSGGVVTINGSDPQKVDVSAVECKINGIDTKTSASTSATISYTSSNIRYDVVVVNSDSTLSIVTGTESANAVLPAVSSTQRALWIIKSTTTTVSLVDDARSQGAYYMSEGRYKYEFTPQDAIDDLTSGGTIYIGAGSYYNPVSISSNGNFTIIYDNNAKSYRTNSTAAEFVVTQDEVTIYGGKFYNNGYSTTFGFMTILGDYFSIYNSYFDADGSSGEKALSIQNCDGLTIYNVRTDHLLLNNSTNVNALFVDDITSYTTSTNTNYYIKFPDDIDTDIETVILTTDGTNLITKVIDIGDWDMNLDSSKSVSLSGVAYLKVVSIGGWIRNDADNRRLTIPSTYENIGGEATTNVAISSYDDSTVKLFREASAQTDSADYDSTSYNRGQLFITYTE